MKLQYMFVICMMLVSCVSAKFSVLTEVESQGLRDKMVWERDFSGERIEYRSSLRYGSYVKIIEYKTIFDGGVLTIGTQCFYIYSGIDSNVHYTGGSLDVDLIDLNGDGERDLIISGIVNYTGEEDSEIYAQENVVFIYYCNMKRGEFIEGYKKASFDITVKDDAANLWLKKYNDSISGEKYRKLDEIKRMYNIDNTKYVGGENLTKQDIKEWRSCLEKEEKESRTGHRTSKERGQPGMALP